VLFVCAGNICRSPFAERVWRALAGDAIAVNSAGFIGPDRAPPSEALTAAAARRIEHADHRSKLLTASLVRSSDAVFAFDRSNVRRFRRTHPGYAGELLWLGDFDPVWCGERSIRDPWGRGAPAFAETFARIERCVAAALTALPAGAWPSAGATARRAPPA
jgi:protein-tyrosine phosphatase